MSRRIALCVALVLAAGCGSSPRPHFYALDPGASPARRVAPAFTVAVGPVSVPDSVDRPQLVLRVGANELVLAEQARWAEPLKASISRVVANRLELELGDARAGVHGKGATDETDYQVRIDIERFDSRPGEAVLIEAAWLVRRPNGGAGLSGRSGVREPAGNSYDALVGAHSRALSAVSRDIAGAIRASRNEEKGPAAVAARQCLPR